MEGTSSGTPSWKGVKITTSLCPDYTRHLGGSGHFEVDEWEKLSDYVKKPKKAAADVEEVEEEALPSPPLRP